MTYPQCAFCSLKEYAAMQEEVRLYPYYAGPDCAKAAMNICD